MTRKTPGQMIRDILGVPHPGDRYGPNEAALEARLFEKTATGLVDFKLTLKSDERPTREELAGVALYYLDAPAATIYP